MINILKESLWRQFGATIDMLKNAITEWPEQSWHSDQRFFYVAYHTLVFLDYSLTVPPPEVFSSSLPFTLAKSESDIPPDAVDDIVPDKIYSKEELLACLRSCREKCRAVIRGLTEENVNKRWVEHEENGRVFISLELLLSSMRHVQHHTAQLNMMLRAKVNSAPDWEARAEDEL